MSGGLAYSGVVDSGRILALDVGDRRIGIAVTDPANLLAQPLFTLQRTTLRADLKSIGRLLRKHDVRTVVVGDPVHADGSPGPQTLRTRAFAEALFAQHGEVAGHLLDERLTTKEAHTLLDRSGNRTGARDRIQRREIIDQVAAVLLLEAFLSQQRGPALLPNPEEQEAASSK